MYRKFFKRFLDIIISLIFILCFWWLYIVIAILVRIKLGSPVLFKQDRPGLNEKIFKMYKFRTMTDEKDKNGNLLPDAERLTKFGKFLRSTSLDEIPELWNVLKGEMSLVGPRPLLVSYLTKYNEYEKRRHEVRPGITGWAQINGRNNTTWEERFKNDIYYVENISFKLDLKIIIKTILKVLKRSDINQSDTETMKNFLDS
ncbi:sugar transferase [Fusobacterium periodonticum]|jgi:Sugar transferases involved in lipopolysaccharide synthesis|uniref:Sugar transferase n=2 Tax=Fusobacterium periodonticum TaxID=860 RepID=A0AAD0MNL0_9FUSO|nr:sugar transferase [Fusobacterium periodonticum]AVQ24288.1 sugar transferase [Fusobacterium periodonticum]KGE62628.1 N-acetyl-D-galactosamine transferase [Fusobacterium periodonticum 2_1_31]